MDVKIKKLTTRGADKTGPGTMDTYIIVEGEEEFIVTYTFHPHRGSRLTLDGEEGTLHIRGEDNRVVRQIVALGGGCALAIHEEVVEGLSPDSLRAVINAQSSGLQGKGQGSNS